MKNVIAIAAGMADGVGAGDNTRAAVMTRGLAEMTRLGVAMGGDPLLAYLVSMAAAVLSAGHWLARPHLFTLLFVVVLLDLLERDRPAPLWLYAPFFAIWANFHGGFSFGLILIGAFLGAWCLPFVFFSVCVSTAAKAIAIPGDWLKIAHDYPGPNTNTLSFVGVPGESYTIQYTTIFDTPNWLRLRTVT